MLSPLPPSSALSSPSLSLLSPLPLLLLLLSSFLALRAEGATVECYWSSPSNMSNPTEGTVITCLNSYSCLKNVDYGLQLVSKGCGSSLNCSTSVYTTNADAYCTNSSNIMTCCCYGNRCNTADRISKYTMPILIGMIPLSMSLFLK